MNDEYKMTNKNSATYPLTTDLKTKILVWANGFANVCYLDSANKNSLYNEFDCLIAVGAKQEIKATGNPFQNLQELHRKSNDWLFGYLGYDLKNELEDLKSNNFDGLEFPNIHFFQAQYIFEIDGKTCKITSQNNASVDELFLEIQKTAIPTFSEINKPLIRKRVGRDKYLEIIKKIQRHIQQGDIYEMNYCQEFYIENTAFEPVQLYLALQQCSPTPYACFYKLDDKYLLSASPERYIKKEGQKLISQPIKGTVARSNNLQKDAQLKIDLQNSQKDKSENIMIVDLVRNDLSRIAQKGSVKVEELFQVYGFEQVYQMISTIVCNLKPELNFTDALKATFPMGSMTGAPKIKAMELIEQFEDTKRGLYSGAVGYIKPNGNFDFNVVIRSMQYNATKKYLSYMVGGAITITSDPESEYEECLLKAKAICEVLNN